MGVEPEVVGGAGEQPEAGGGAAGPPVKRQGETPRRQIRRAKQATRRRFSAEDKIRIVMEGIRGEEPVSAICRREGIQSTVYYRWLKDFMEAGKQRLRGDTLREAGRDEVQALKAENQRLKELVADYALETLALKKSLTEG
jgi:transposase